MDYRIMTPCGELQGCAGRIPGVAAYKGIRYATAGRWEYPRLVTAWQGLYEATHYGSCCYQPQAFRDEESAPEKSFYYREFRKGEHYTYSEDCLFLNVFTPESASPEDRLPVLVYIHGGGFVGGCSNEKPFDCPVWPNYGVIGVTLNYRVGPLGFLTLPELKQEAGKTGNYGLYDQLAALQWIHDNIAAFGGDPDNVTIMGQSAGAMSVQQHCFSPLSRELFHKAVMSSGGGVSRALSAPAPEAGYDFWHSVMEHAGCMDLVGFRELPVEALFESWQALKKNARGGGCVPCLDGQLIVGTGVELLRGNRQKPIAYLAGTTSEDMLPPILFKMAKSWCAAQKTNSYCWFFNRRLPGDDCGAWHSSDLWYWFGTLRNCWRPMTRKDDQLSRQMVSYLTNFCKYGDPNGTGLTAWLPASQSRGAVLCLGEEQPHMGKPSLLKLAKTMLTNKPVGQ